MLTASGGTGRQSVQCRPAGTCVWAKPLRDIFTKSWHVLQSRKHDCPTYPSRLDPMLRPARPVSLLASRQRKFPTIEVVRLPFSFAIRHLCLCSSSYAVKQAVWEDLVFFVFFCFHFEDRRAKGTGLSLTTTMPSSTFDSCPASCLKAVVQVPWMPRSSVGSHGSSRDESRP